MEQKLEKWENWLKTITYEIVHLASSRQIYTETAQIILWDVNWIVHHRYSFTRGQKAAGRREPPVRSEHSL